jgi:high-affinity Fe2+/Pb2+ permease
VRLRLDERNVSLSTLASAALALAMIAAMILAVGGIKLLGRDRQRGLLMMAAALVLVGNVLIWTL